jgi:hypothetical protein
MTTATSSPKRGALAAVLIGGLFLLSAWAMAAVSTFSESSTSCPSVLGRDLVAGSGEEEFCVSIIDERTRLVLIVGIIGLMLVVAGFVRGRSHLFGRSPLTGRVSVVTRVGLAVLGLLTLVLSFPLWVVAVFLTDAMNREVEDFFRAMLPTSIAFAAVTAAAIASLLGRRGHRLTLDHSMAAVSLAAPLLALILIDRDGLGVTDPGLIDPAWTSSAPRFFVCGIPVAVALWVLAMQQNRERPAPPAGVSGLALIASATALTLAMVPDVQGGDTDQSLGRFTFWIAVAVLTPWVTFAAWKLSAVAAATLPADRQSDFA